MKTIFYLATCDTCRRILKELNPSNDVLLREIKSQPLSAAELDQLVQLAGSHEALFSRNSRQYRALGLHEQQLTEKDYRKYLLQDYTFLKRPVVVVGQSIFIGNAKQQTEAAKAALA